MPADVKTELNHRKLRSSSSKTDALNRSFSPQKTATTTFKTQEKTLPTECSKSVKKQRQRNNLLKNFEHFQVSDFEEKNISG